MELLHSPKEIETIANANPSKKIGKITINCDKVVTDKRIQISDGHANCIQTLRDAACEIIIVEFINAYTLFSGSASITNFKSPEIIDSTLVLNMCISAKLDADYILYNSNDAIGNFNSAVVDLVNSRLVIEDYKNLLKIPDKLYEMLKIIFYWFTSRNTPSNVMLARSYKTGSDSIAIKHYINKYCNFEFLPIYPINYIGTKIPISTFGDIDAVSAEAKDFCNYFHQIEKSTIINDSAGAIQADLEKYASNLGYEAKEFLIVDDPEYVGIGKVFISVVFYGPHNSKLMTNRWL